MATYDFTVRATDAKGAYSDRDFSISVNNTNIRRFVVVGPSGLMHSADGAAWTSEAGQCGKNVTFGNGQWVVYGGILSATTTQVNPNQPATDPKTYVRTSPDGVNWTMVPLTLPRPNVSGGAAVNPSYAGDATCIRYVKETSTWHLFTTTLPATVSGGTTYYSWYVEYTSTDFINWTQKGVATYYASGNVPRYSMVHDFLYDVNSGRYIAIVSAYNVSSIWYRNASTAWTSALSVSLNANDTTASYAYNFSGSISSVGGLFCASLGEYGNQPTVYTSIDAVNWTKRLVTTGSAFRHDGFTYNNGRLYSRVGTVTGSGNTVLWESRNAGRTWTQVSTIFSGASGIWNGARHAPIASYGGTTLMLPDNTAQSIHVTKNGTTWTSVTTPDIGTAYGIAVRNT